MQRFGKGLCLRACLTWLVLAIWVVSCAAPPPALKQPSPLPVPVGAPIWLEPNQPASGLTDLTKSQKLRSYQKAVPGDFRLQGFVPNPDPDEPYALAKPNLINNTANGDSFWVFTFWVPTGKTTTINVDIARTEPCQSSFFPTSFNIVLEPNPDIPAIEYEYGVGPSSNTKDGAYALSLSDETGQSFSYTVYVNNGIPAVCPTSAPTPTPTPVPCKGNPKNCASPTPTPTPTPTPSPTPTHCEVGSDCLPCPEGEVCPPGGGGSGTPLPTATPSIAPTPEPTATPTPGPTSTPTPRPTSTPSPQLNQIGINTKSIDFSEIDYSITIKGEVHGASENFDPNSITVDLDSNILIKKQDVVSFSMGNPDFNGFYKADFEIKISDYQVFSSKKSLFVQDVYIGATFPDIQRNNVTLISDNSFGKINENYRLASSKEIVNVKEKIHCNKGIDCNNAFFTRWFEFVKALDLIYNTYYSSALPPGLIIEGGGYVPIQPVDHIINSLEVNSLVVNSSGNFRTLNSLAVSNGFVQLFAPAAAAPMLIDFGLKVSLINPVVGGLALGGGVVITAVILYPMANDLLSDALAWASAHELGNNLGRPAPDYIIEPQAHHIIAQKFSLHQSLIQRVVNSCLQNVFPQGVDTALNGVWVPKAFHTGPNSNIHTHKYYQYILDMINRAFQQGGCEEVRNILKQIKDILTDFVNANVHPNKAVRDAARNRFFPGRKNPPAPRRNDLPWE